MNKQELIDRYQNFENVLDDIGARVACKHFLKDLEQLDEPEKVKVPQFVAEIIEYYKGQNATLYDALREKNFNKQYNEWLMNEQDAYNKVARAWLDGYEVEKEKRYVVKVKGNIKENMLVYGEFVKRYFFTKNSSVFNVRYSHTRKELEEAGFGWVFSCEGIEIEEVE